MVWRRTSCGLSPHAPRARGLTSSFGGLADLQPGLEPQWTPAGHSLQGWQSAGLRAPANLPAPAGEWAFSTGGGGSGWGGGEGRPLSCSGLGRKFCSLELCWALRWAGGGRWGWPHCPGAEGGGEARLEVGGSAPPWLPSLSPHPRTGRPGARGRPGGPSRLGVQRPKPAGVGFRQVCPGGLPPGQGWHTERPGLAGSQLLFLPPPSATASANSPCTKRISWPRAPWPASASTSPPPPSSPSTMRTRAWPS